MNIDPRLMKVTEDFLSSYKEILTSKLGHQPEGWSIFEEEYIDHLTINLTPTVNQQFLIQATLNRKCLIYEEFLGII